MFSKRYRLRVSSRDQGAAMAETATRPNPVYIARARVAYWTPRDPEKADGFRRELALAMLDRYVREARLTNKERAQFIARLLDGDGE